MDNNILFTTMKNIEKNTEFRFLLTAFCKFLGLAAVAVLPFLAIYLDIFVLHTDLNGQSEQSVVEYSQDLALIIMVSLFSYQAYRFPQYRAGFVLIAGFLLCMLIRELDQYLDSIAHSIWVIPALIVALSSSTYALLRRQQTLAGLTCFVKNSNYFIFAVGLVLLLVTSRLFGSGFLWKAAMGEHYLRTVKHIIEECGELVGYTFMLLGSLLFSHSLSKLPK